MRQSNQRKCGLCGMPKGEKTVIRHGVENSRTSTKGKGGLHGRPSKNRILRPCRERLEKCTITAERIEGKTTGVGGGGGRGENIFRWRCGGKKNAHLPVFQGGNMSSPSAHWRKEEGGVINKAAFSRLANDGGGASLHPKGKAPCSWIAWAERKGDSK